MKSIKFFSFYYTKKLLLFAVIFSPFCAAKAQKITFKQTDSEQLTKEIEAVKKETNFPGSQVLIFTKDSIVYKKNFGVKNIKTKEAVTDESMFRIGSCTKSFVATSALQMIEKGQLSLNDELKVLAPEIKFENKWEATDPIRIVHLLEHTTGFDDWALKDYAVNDPTMTLQKGIDFGYKSRVVRWRPGTFMSYCNSGPPLVARIIEKKVGKPFEQIAKENIFDPLGIKNMSFKYDGAVPENLVTNHSEAENKIEPYWHILMRPAGSINSSALDLMPFVQMLMNRGTYQGKQILKPESVDRMEIPTTTLAAKAGLKEGYGLHNYTSSYKGYVFHGHNGGVNGGLAHYAYNTELDLGIIILVNSDGEGFGKIEEKVMENVMQSVPMKQFNGKMTDEQKNEILGYYRANIPRNEIFHVLEWIVGVQKVYEDSNRIYTKSLLSGDANELIPNGNNQFIMKDKKGNTPSAIFIKDDEGETIMSSLFQNARKTNALSAWLPLIMMGVATFFVFSGLLWGIIWGIRYFILNNKQRKMSAMKPRMAVTLFSLILIIMVITLAVNINGFGLGNFAAPSIIVFVSTILMAILGVLGLYWLYRSSSTIPNRWDRAFVWVNVLSCFALVAYLAYWGMIGVRFWA